MNHGILDQEWNDYLDGKVTAEVCYRIDAHCAVCLECSEFREQMSCATQLLTEAANEARRRFTLKEKQIDHLLGGILTRIRTNGFDFRVCDRLDRLNHNSVKINKITMYSIYDSIFKICHAINDR